MGIYPHAAALQGASAEQLSQCEASLACRLGLQQDAAMAKMYKIVKEGLTEMLLSPK